MKPGNYDYHQQQLLSAMGKYAEQVGPQKSLEDEVRAYAHCMGITGQGIERIREILTPTWPRS